MKVTFFVGISLFFVSILLISCNAKPAAPDITPVVDQPVPDTEPPAVVVGAAATDRYFPQLEGKGIGLVVNQTSMIGNRHLVDSLVSAGMNVKAIFAPEHGFRGTADAGEKIKDGKDASTGLPVISLYGKKKEPSAEDLAGIEMLVFDIQDVGARFYTYISTLHYIMRACAREGIMLLILDRPNPNGHYVDGPVMQAGMTSFVGIHEGVPVVHGMTVGEYAQMVNAEGWLGDGLACSIMLIKCQNYTHATPYTLPIKPSPNLPNQRSIYLYPSLCFFEGTTFSAGRGTEKQFQLFGHPDYPDPAFSFTPISRPGAKYPKHEDALCYGMDLSDIALDTLYEKGELDLTYLVDAYQRFPDKDAFFIKNNFFDKLAGGPALREQIKAGKTAAEIRMSWQADLMAFKALRQKYLMYP